MESSVVRKSVFFYPYIVLLFFFLQAHISFSQDVDLQHGRRYIIGGIDVQGAKEYSKETVIAYTGLVVGQPIMLPGEKISSIVTKLWQLSLFSDVNIYITKVEGEKAFLEINIKELPSLNSYRFVGISKSKAKTFEKDLKIKKGLRVNSNFIASTRNYIIKKYLEKGYNEPVVNIATRKTDKESVVDVVITIKSGAKAKIKAINIEGNERYKDATVRQSMKKTKQIFFGRIWKRSKYIKTDFEKDLVSLVDFYKERGYRDARVVSDTVVKLNSKQLNIDIKVEEGRKYYFGDIAFLGNSVYPDRLLHQILGIKKGDVYNGVLLKKRIADNTKPDAEDITNLYQNNGYLFSTINPVEVSVKNDTINFEIRIIEGKPAYFNNIIVSGNERTNDHVIYREMRTRPGELYSKENIIRTVRELSQLNFFDNEKINPNLKNVNPNDGTVDLQYDLEEKGSTQIELQGGYGGGGFIGTLGLVLNNFSIKNVFNKKEYRPLPLGDGQSLALRLQGSQSYQQYSLTFAEPWLGGKRPIRLSVTLSHAINYLANYSNGFNFSVDKSKYFLSTGINVGLAKRLRFPDDYFTIGHYLGYQYYDLRNFSYAPTNLGYGGLGLRGGLGGYGGGLAYGGSSLFNFGGNGSANAFTYLVTLSRNSSGPNPIYPMQGSNIMVSFKTTPPYSLFNSTDYANLGNLDEYKKKDSQGFYQGVLGNRVYKIEDAAPDDVKINRKKYKFLEYYKIKFSIEWYTTIIKKLVLRTSLDFGYLGAYNKALGDIPFERFFVGGSGLQIQTLDGRENIRLRGYPNQSLSSGVGSTVYNRFSLELRYPVTLKPAASIFVLAFAEGGRAYENFRQLDPYDIKRSAGGGIRIFMPAFGLLGFDVGYGFDPIYSNRGTPSGWQTHFLIGQQF